MVKSSWDDMKRSREEEFIQREEREKLAKLREKVLQKTAHIQQSADALASFERGFSPLRGGAMYKKEVAGEHILDCPQEGSVMMTYTTLSHILTEASRSESESLEHWRQFIENSTEKQAEKEAE